MTEEEADEMIVAEIRKRIEDLGKGAKKRKRQIKKLEKEASPAARDSRLAEYRKVRDWFASQDESYQTEVENAQKEYAQRVADYEKKLAEWDARENARPRTFEFCGGLQELAAFFDALQPNGPSL